MYLIVVPHGSLCKPHGRLCKPHGRLCKPHGSLLINMPCVRNGSGILVYS